MLMLQRNIGQRILITNDHGDKVALELTDVGYSLATIKISHEEKGVLHSYEKIIHLNNTYKVFNGNYISPDVYGLKLVEVLSAGTVVLGIAADSSVRINREELE